MLLGLTNEFQWRRSSAAGVRPGAAQGTALTPAQNAKGAWAQVFSALENDAWGIHINFNSNSVSAQARDTIVDIGIDPAGGTSYSVLIPDLLATGASTMATAAGINYYFPIRIPAGATVAARASVNNATVGTLRCWCTVFGRPRRPELVRVGSYVTALGINAAASAGTTVTPGTTSDGAWVSLGTPTKSHWWWQMGMGVNDATMTTNSLFADLAMGDVTNKVIVLEDIHFETASSEYMCKGGEWSPDFRVPENVQIWARAQNSGANDSAYSLAAYAVGG